MQFGGQAKPPLGVVYDADFGGSIDGALGLALLYGLQGKNESRVVSVTTSRPSIGSAAFADVLVRFYTGEPGGFFQPQPIGMAAGAKAPEDTPTIAAVLSKPYSRGVRKLNDTADPVATLRNALSAQFDGNAVVVLAGPATNLLGLMELPGAKDLIARKVKLLCAVETAAGQPSGWPTPVVLVPKKAGEELPLPLPSYETAVSWTQTHPIMDAWRAAGGGPTPTAPLIAGLYAVRPQENYFQLADRRLTPDPAQKDKTLQAFIELASTKQVPRRGRRGG